MQDDQHNTGSTTSQQDDQNLLDQDLLGQDVLGMDSVEGDDGELDVMDDGDGELQMELDISDDQELLEELRIGNYPGSPRHEFMEKLEELARELEEKGISTEAITQIVTNVQEQYKLGNVAVKQGKVGKSGA